MNFKPFSEMKAIEQYINCCSELLMVYTDYHKYWTKIAHRIIIMHYFYLTNSCLSNPVNSSIALYNSLPDSYKNVNSYKMFNRLLKRCSF